MALPYYLLLHIFEGVTKFPALGKCISRNGWCFRCSTCSLNIVRWKRSNWLALPWTNCARWEWLSWNINVYGCFFFLWGLDTTNYGFQKKKCQNWHNDGRKKREHCCRRMIVNQFEYFVHLQSVVANSIVYTQTLFQPAFSMKRARMTHSKRLNANDKNEY